MWAMGCSVSTPPDRHSTTRAGPSPPAPAVDEIWLLGRTWGELCVELSGTATGELGAVVCWSCSAAKYCLGRTSGCGHAACGSAISCRWRDDHDPTASARAVFIARHRLLFPQARRLLSQGAVAAKALVLWIAYSVWRARVSSNISNSTTSEQPTPTALEPTTLS